MNKKLAAALAGGAALALALTGCGDDKGKETEAWAKDVCQDVKPQVRKIQQANESINQASEEKQSPKEVQKADSAAFQDISEAYKALAKAVDAAGDPPVDDGATLRKNAVKELNGLSTEYGELKKTVDEMDTGDQSKFADGLQDLAERLGKLGKSGDKSLQKLQSGELGAAMAEQPGCKKPSSAGTPSA
ncbi:small secreted protein [Streptomyces sp. JJ36]|uniref:small secreted protein n=1 Tax=Streptomyces sp. JJ36 TaxID=2736645 RepID=UPI001F20DB2B|nr:small secreted protein [Streptomyces sp. JJ36]MCF6522585.1 small secreted protein [Streptomyces sp. JJ36]